MTSSQRELEGVGMDDDEEEDEEEDEAMEESDDRRSEAAEVGSAAEAGRAQLMHPT